MSKQKSECQLPGKYRECCCTCHHRLRVLEVTIGQKQIGWACIVAWDVYNEDIVYVGDFEHGLCEIYKPRKRRVRNETK